MTRRKLNLSILIIGLCFACKQEIKTAPKEQVISEDVAIENNTVSIDSLIANLKNPYNDQVIVVAHRGDWRNAPENSLQAIKNCIDMGVDMVEIDVRETKDGQLVLMHDERIDRTTTGTGKVADVTWDYLQTVELRDGIGHRTAHKVPTLEEVLALTKGKILVNLDKSYEIFDKCYKIVEKTGTQKEVIIKGQIPYDQVKEEFGVYLDKIFFMPIVRLNNPDAKSIINSYLENLKPVAFEFTVPQDTIALISDFEAIRSKGSSIWVNSLWPEHNGGHDDEKAVLDTSVYDWFIKNHIDIIQTDRPQNLISYLRQKGLHQ